MGSPRKLEQNYSVLILPLLYIFSEFSSNHFGNILLWYLVLASPSFPLGFYEV